MAQNVLAFATKGSGTNDEDRLRTLLSGTRPRFFAWDRRRKARSFRRLLTELLRCRPDLVVMEGTGIAGGAACLLARLLKGTPYVVSSGDAVGPFIGAHHRGLGAVFGLYERLLCRLSAGFIGWTPYLVGRALTFGAPRGVTAAGWAGFRFDPESVAESRSRIRGSLGIPETDLVFGIVGSLSWNRRVSYCYGAELVRALKRVARDDVRVIVVGGGNGFEQLRSLAGTALGSRIHLVGPAPQSEVPAWLAAMDVASLPQSIDGVGSFRYTTKISEYIAARIPLVTNRVPMAYDLGGDWQYRLPGRSPWDPIFIEALAALMTRLRADEVKAKQASVPNALADFDRDRQVSRVTDFLSELLRERRTALLRVTNPDFTDHNKSRCNPEAPGRALPLEA